VTEAQEYRCDSCGGPLGQRPWHGIPYICGKCEVETLNDTPDLTGPYIESYYELAGARNTIAKIFNRLEFNGTRVTEGVDPIAEVVDQIEELISKFHETLVENDEQWDDTTGL
jgi:hypothetical protein